MKLTIDDDWTATVTDDPLHIAPRFDFWDFRLRIATYANVEERGRFLLDTLGSQPWLWDTPDDSGSIRRAGNWSAPSLRSPVRPPMPRTLPAFPPRPSSRRADSARTRPGTSAWR